MKTPYLFLAFLLFLPACGRSGSQAPITVGHIGALSGPEGQGDEQAAKGLRLALTDPSLAKVEDRPLLVRHTDTRDQLDAYEAQAVRLVSVSKAGVLYGGNTPEQVMRMDRARVPLLSPSGYHPAGVSDLTFFLGLSPSFQGQCLAQFASDRLSLISCLALWPFGLLEETYRPTAVVFRDERREEADQVSRAFVKTWDEAWAKRGEVKVPSPLVVTFKADVKWADLAAKGWTAGPLCVLFAGGPEDFRALLAHVPAGLLLLYGGPDGSLPEVPAGRTVYRTTAFSADPGVSGDFIKKFTDAYKAPPDVHAALAYDGMRLLSAGLKKVTPSTSLSSELRGLKDFPGLTGPVTFGPDQVLRRPAFLVRCEARGAALEKKFDP